MKGYLAQLGIGNVFVVNLKALDTKGLYVIGVGLR